MPIPNGVYVSKTRQMNIFPEMFDRTDRLRYILLSLSMMNTGVIICVLTYEILMTNYVIKTFSCVLVT